MKLKGSRKNNFTFWHISEQFRGTEPAKTFSSIDNVLSLQGTMITSSPISRVIKVASGGRFFYVKTYSRGGKRLRRFLGRSRARAEWENLLFFEQIGIPTPNIVAYGQKTWYGIIKHGALITEELPNTIDMAAMAQEQSPLLKDRRWVKQVAIQLADFTKRLHDSGFVHVDLKWRNILVTRGEKPRLFFIDCPLGHKSFGFRLRRGIIKDLACLDKIAKLHISRSDRLFFSKSYNDRNKLDKADKRQIKKVLSFFSGRQHRKAKKPYEKLPPTQMAKNSCATKSNRF